MKLDEKNNIPNHFEIKGLLKNKNSLLKILKATVVSLGNKAK
jgi:hypothetical protein